MAPIHQAAYYGDLGEVTRLVSQDSQVVRLQDEDGATALHRACDANQKDVATFLLNNGSGVNQQDHKGYSSLSWACMGGHLPIVELLMEKGADAGLAYQDGWTPLMEASCYGHAPVARCLLNHHLTSSIINHRSNGGETALWCASKQGHAEVVRVLLEANADPSVRDHTGRTPMEVAANEACTKFFEEWQRHYELAKARYRYDSTQGACPPLVQSAATDDSSTMGGRTTRGQAEKDRLKVLEYVVCGGLKDDVTVELMEMLGKTGERQRV